MRAFCGYGTIPSTPCRLECAAGRPLVLLAGEQLSIARQKGCLAGQRQDSLIRSSVRGKGPGLSRGWMELLVGGPCNDIGPTVSCYG